MNNIKLTLETICGGAVQERVDRALEKCARNILDPNTDQKKKRTITLKITLDPNEDDPEDVEVTAEVTTKLAPETGVTTRLFVNKDLMGDRVTVTEHRKGEIRGQLNFSDLGLSEDIANIDVETGEMQEASDNTTQVLDLRQHKEGRH